MSMYEGYEEIAQDDGTVLFVQTIVVGGRDEEGRYFYVLEGPAQGEKVYE